MLSFRSDRDVMRKCTLREVSKESKVSSHGKNAIPNKGRTREKGSERERERMTESSAAPRP